MAKRKSKTKKKVVKWIGKIGLKKGRFTEWCKMKGFGGPTATCISQAMKSKSKSVRGMGLFAKRAKANFKKKVS